MNFLYIAIIIIILIYPTISRGSIANFKRYIKGDESDPDSDTEDEAREKGDFPTLLFAAKNDRVDIIDELVERGVLEHIISEVDDDGYSALHCAAYSASVRAAVTLIKHGADVNAKTKDGWTPLHSAARWNRSSIKYLAIHFFKNNWKERTM